MTFVQRPQRMTIMAAMVLSLAVPGVARAQTPPPTPPGQGQKTAQGEEAAKPTQRFFPALFHNLGEDLRHIPRRNSIYWLAAGSALALAVHPSDNQINRRLRGSGLAETMFKPGKYVGSLPVLLGTGVTTWAIGRHRHQTRTPHLGMDLIESSLLSEGIVEAIKFSVRRDRPLRTDGTRASGYSFPSGHATMTFAAAGAAAAPGMAVGGPDVHDRVDVAISRLHDERHFASDVAFGAGVGIIIGRSVTWHGRNFYASPMLLPRGAGIMVNLKPRR